MKVHAFDIALIENGQPAITCVKMHKPCKPKKNTSLVIKDGAIKLYGLVDEQASKVERFFLTIGTGVEINDDLANRARLIQSFLIDNIYGYHVFELDISTETRLDAFGMRTYKQKIGVTWKKGRQFNSQINALLGLINQTCAEHDLRICRTSREEVLFLVNSNHPSIRELISLLEGAESVREVKTQSLKEVYA